jgi:hypothetical protein
MDRRETGTRIPTNQVAPARRPVIPSAKVGTASRRGIHLLNNLFNIGVLQSLNSFLLFFLREKGSLMSKVTRSRSEQLRRGRKKRRLFNDPSQHKAVAHAAVARHLAR